MADDPAPSPSLAARPRPRSLLLAPAGHPPPGWRHVVLDHRRPAPVAAVRRPGATRPALAVRLDASPSARGLAGCRRGRWRSPRASPPPMRATGDGAGPLVAAAARRRPRAGAAAVDAVAGLAAELRAGLPVASALAAAGPALRPPQAVGEAARRVGERVGTAVAVAESSGAPLADVLDRLDHHLRAVDRARAAAEAQAAGARVSALLLAGLPVAGVGLGPRRRHRPVRGAAAHPARSRVPGRCGPASGGRARLGGATDPARGVHMRAFPARKVGAGAAGRARRRAGGRRLARRGGRAGRGRGLAAMA